MTDTISTLSVGRDFVKTKGVLLEQTSDTALVFFPEIHPGGVRGDLIRFKKNRSDEWEKIPEQDFRKLQVYQGAHIELGTQQLRKLTDEVQKREQISKQGVQPGLTKYVVAEEDKVIIVDDKNKIPLIQQVLDKGYSTDFWKLLIISHPDLANKLSAGQLQMQRKAVVDELKERLTRSFPETASADSWQNWIYLHNWLFGVNYHDPIEKQRINITGIMPDYLFPTLDQFVDILEIKLPSEDIILQDASHNGSWVWAEASNYAIGQIVNYLGEIERQRLEIERNIRNVYGLEFSLLKPRAFILIGESFDWTLSKKEGLRKLNNSLHGIEVISYTDLVKRGEVFVDFGPDLVI
ncbi:hypothetical protein A2Z22_01735 [Candidatus Woesebacteria bacterium RBG_16_34_12]|uniref:Shedu protein SduA C-terminal domain-containing protein n=1 Tax=Candidatus Woesebacteria bacterium RBG_16_34_12 TaxID=1802480 RepID=A0A1F7XA95_9BACT|nr:MAG: hypothetical protein A2Z22_01735 [Candidatus Woesebacteria bacterium RBG_16_34_12]